MKSNWKKIKLADLVNINPRRSVKKGTIVPFIAMTDLVEGARDIPTKTEKEFGSGTKFIDGDTLFARITPCLENGKTALVSGLGTGVIAAGSTEFIVLNPKNIDTDKYFIYYLARLPELRAYAEKKMEGTSGRQRVSAQALGDFELSLPPPDIRRAIGQFLANIDDKIEANTRMNHTLEKIAQRIFKSWFIDFDPVKANAEGVPFGGLSPDIQSLFPSEFVESEMGLIPKGWEVSTIGKEFDVTMGQSPPGSSYNETGEGTLFFQGRRDFGFRYPSERVYTNAPKRLAKAGDTLLSVRAPVGDVNKALKDCCIGRGVGALRHKSGCESYTYYSALRLRTIFESYDKEGTVFGSINQTDLKSLSVIAPNEEVLRAFNSVIAPLDKRITINTHQINSLTKLRDKLLPKLLSGSIEINDDIEEQIAEAS